MERIKIYINIDLIDRLDGSNAPNDIRLEFQKCLDQTARAIYKNLDKNMERFEEPAPGWKDKNEWLKYFRFKILEWLKDGHFSIVMCPIDINAAFVGIMPTLLAMKQFPNAELIYGT